MNTLANITKFQGVFWSRTDTLIKSFDYITFDIILYKFCNMNYSWLEQVSPGPLQEEKEEEREAWQRPGTAAGGPVDSLRGGTWEEKMLKFWLG